MKSSVIPRTGQLNSGKDSDKEIILIQDYRKAVNLTDLKKYDILDKQ